MCQDLLKRLTTLSPQAKPTMSSDPSVGLMWEVPQDSPKPLPSIEHSIISNVFYEMPHHVHVWHETSLAIGPLGIPSVQDWPLPLPVPVSDLCHLRLGHSLRYAYTYNGHLGQRSPSVMWTSWCIVWVPLCHIMIVRNRKVMHWGAFLPMFKHSFMPASATWSSWITWCPEWFGAT